MENLIHQKRRFTLSSRKMGKSMMIYNDLVSKFNSLQLGDISLVISTFGFVKHYTPLYGGRPFRKANSLSFIQINQLHRKGIGFSLNLTNHYYNREAYLSTLPLLEKLYDKKNAIICTNDELARQIRLDFPEYQLIASVIKNISSLSEIHQALELYDYVVLHPKLNDDISFLQSIDCKEKIVLFATIHCLYLCNEKDCFLKISEVNKNPDTKKQNYCKHKHDPTYKKLKIFDLNDSRFEGFSLFKVVF